MDIQNPSVEEVIYEPLEYPNPNDMRVMLADAVREYVGNNMLRGVTSNLEPVLGDDSDIFNDSIMYRSIGLEGSLDLFTGKSPVRQIIGKVLHDTDVFRSFLKSRSNIMISGEHMISRTRVYTTPDIDTIEVRYKTPYTPVVARYLRSVNPDIRMTISDGELTVFWLICCNPEDMSGINYVIANLESALTVYYKLLTRLSCQHLARSLPTFRNS